jgi:hypothetical protein
MLPRELFYDSYVGQPNMETRKKKGTEAFHGDSKAEGEQEGQEE